MRVNKHGTKIPTPVRCRRGPNETGRPVVGSCFNGCEPSGGVHYTGMTFGEAVVAGEGDLIQYTNPVLVCVFWMGQ